ncbi:MAG: hypothetical protein ACE5IH_00065 [Thermodesulfobacteriota bacterium]
MPLKKVDRLKGFRLKLIAFSLQPIHLNSYKQWEIRICLIKRPVQKIL